MRSMRAGRVLGVEVFVDPSLLVLVVILAWSLFIRFNTAFPATSNRALLALSVGGGVLFMASVLAHELSHSVVARRRGLTVKRIRLFIFGGVSEIEQDARTPGEEFAVAFAGPAASLVVGGAFLLGAWPFSGPAASMVRLLGLMNLLLAVFNLLPGLPLDGGRVLHALMWRRGGDRARATQTAVTVGRGLGVAMMLGGGVLVAGWGDLAGVWLLAVGWFLHQAAASSLLRERLRERAGEGTVGDVMRPLFESADGGLTVAALLERYGWGDHLRTLPVTIDGRVRGVIGDHEVAATAPDARSTVTVAQAMTTIGRDDVVDASEPILEFLARKASPARRVLVVNDHRVVGIITAEELVHLFE